VSDLTKPLPDVTDPLTASFWEGTKNDRLLLPRCSNCGYLEWPPEISCPVCKARAFEWSEFAPEGTLWSYAVYYRALDPSFGDDVPYAVGLIELDVGKKMYGIMQGNLEDLEVGRRVHGVFRVATPEVTFLDWKVDREL
jgi:uncharacterized OB-fold protein